MWRIRPLMIAVLTSVLFAVPAAAENYAVLFAGGIDPNHNKERYYNNTLRMYNLVTQHLGYLPKNIWVLASDGTDPNLDAIHDNGTFFNSNWSTVVANGSTVLSATPANLQNTLANLPTGPADLLYFWSFDHGGGSSGATGQTDEEVLCGWGGNIDDDALAGWVRNKAGREAFVFTQCFAGGLIDDLGIWGGSNRFACAATNHYEFSWGEGFAKAFADGFSSFGTTYSTYNLYTYARNHDPYYSALTGEGPGGTWQGDNTAVEHPWKTGDDLTLKVVLWTGSGSGGSGHNWSDANNWQSNQFLPTMDSTVRLRFNQAGYSNIDGNSQAGYLVVDSNSAVGLSACAELMGGNSLTSNYQTFGDVELGYFAQYGGTNTVNRDLCLGEHAGSQGHYAMAGGQLTASTIYVGRRGWAEFAQYNSATVNVTNMYISQYADYGLYTLSDSATLNSFNVFVGGDSNTAGNFIQWGGTHNCTGMLWLYKRGYYALYGGTLTTWVTDIISSDSANGYGFYLAGGTHTITNSMIVSGGGFYKLISGTLTTPYMSDYGNFTQIGGDSNFGYVKVTSSSGTCNLSGGTMTTGKLYVQYGGTFNQTGGTLNVTDSNCAYVGYQSQGTFIHTGGDATISNKLYIGYSSWSSGTYTLNLASGSLTVNNEIRIGADSGKGRFEYLSYTPGSVTTGKVTLGSKGTLAIGFNTNVNVIFDGTLFGGATMTGLDNGGTLEATNGATLSQNWGPYTYRAVRVGSSGGGGTFTLNAGAGNDTTHYLEINSNGLFNYTSGNLAIDTGGLHLAGVMNFGGNPTSVNIGANSLVNLQDGTFQNAWAAGFHVNAASCLTIVPVGFNPGQFAAYSNAGRTYVAGGTLVIAANESYTFEGHIKDHVKCSGSLTATAGGFLDLQGGVDIQGNGSVDTSGAILIIIDSNSGIFGYGGHLTSDGMQVGVGSSGTFTQLGGYATLTGDLYLGCDANGTGTYNMYPGSTLETPALHVGYAGTGHFVQNQGFTNLGGDLYVGELPGGQGNCEIHGGTVYAGGLYVGGDANVPGGSGSLSVDPNVIVTAALIKAYAGGTVTLQDANVTCPLIVLAGGSLGGKGLIKSDVDVTDGSIAASSASDVLILAQALTNNASSTLTKTGAGTVAISGTIGSLADSTFRVQQGTVYLGISSGTVQVEPNALLAIAPGASVSAYGTIDPFTDASDPNQHMNVLNNSGSSFNIVVGNKAVGWIDQDPNLALTGKTAVSAAASLTASHICQARLELNGVPTNPASVTIRCGAVAINAIDNLSLVSGRLTYEAPALPNLAPSGTIVTKSLSLDSHSQLDLATNNMIIDYTGGSSPLSTIVSYIATGYAGGAWNGNGISSSTIGAQDDPGLYAIGVIDNTNSVEGSDPPDANGWMTSMEGVATPASSVLVKFTWAGDADLNGKVNIDDAASLNWTWLMNGEVEGPPDPNNPWFSGDFNYDGLINIDDAGLLNWVWLSNGEVESPSLDYSSIYGALPVNGEASTSNLPEPGTLVLLAAGGLFLIRRHRGK